VVPARVTVIGDAVLDVRAVPATPIRPGADVPGSVEVGPGGQGANLAVRLARRGVAARLVCRIGSDEAGDLLRRALESDGVELFDLGTTRTGAVLVLLDADGERTMLSHRVPLLTPGLPIAAVLDAEWVVVSGYVLLEPSAGMSPSGPVPRRAIAGCALDAAQAGAWLDAARSLQPHLLVVNDDEARVLASVEAEDAAGLCRVLSEVLGAIVVVTGRSGATAVIGDEIVTSGASTDTTPVDTTGAGDAFTAALVAGLLETGWPPPAHAFRSAMATAQELAAAVTRVPGAQGRVVGERGSS
jgi:sugar/nucleoside kinase (ribokinase family)